MSRFFHFRLNERNSSLPAWQIIFSAAEDFSQSEFRDVHSDDVMKHGAPDAIVILARVDRFKAWHRDISKLAKIRSEWRIDPAITPIMVAAYNASGDLSDKAPAGAVSIELSPADFAGMQKVGLTHLFHRRGGLLLATGNTHFVHPSRKHSLVFVRTANLLVDGNETNFIAMCILRYLAADLEYLWVDTSSIASLAHAVTGLRMSLDQNFKRPIISSFGSWDALVGDFTFPASERQTLLISASTSGRMANDLHERTKIANDRIITLFSLSAASGLTEVCNLADSISSDITVQSSESDKLCRYCNAGWTRIEFLGDQFLVDAIRYEPVDITVNRQAATQRPLNHFMTKYHGYQALQMQAAPGAETANDFYIDTDKLVGTSSEFRNSLAEAVARHIPAGSKLFVSDESGAFTSEIKRLLDASNGSTTPTMSQIDLAQRNREIEATESSVVAAARAISSGASLERASRDLREPFGDRPRTFIIGVSKHAHLPRTERMRRNLQWSNGNYKHVIVELEKVCLPKPQKLSAWQAEVLMLRAILNRSGKTEDSLDAGILGERLSRLRELAKPSANGLFWACPAGNELKLAPTFAFFDAEREVSQGDILWTIGWALEALRNEPNPKLVRTTGHQTVISPAMFDRFNDGVIQAALLRMAQPHELFYAATPDLSAEMADILETSLGSSESGSFEFLTSLACGRLRLQPADLDRVLDSATDLHGPAPHLVRWMKTVQTDKLSIFGGDYPSDSELF